MANPVTLSVHSAQKAANEVGTILDTTLGGSQFPNGKVYSLYSSGVYALKGLLSEKKGASAIVPARKILASTKSSVVQAVSSALDNSNEIGRRAAVEQVSYYLNEMGVSIGEYPAFESHAKDYTRVVRSLLDSQEISTLAMIGAELPNELIVGDDEKPGIYKSSGLIQQFDLFITSALWMIFLDVAGWAGKKAGVEFQKLAVAAIDHKTTNCCLKVHGEIVPLNMPFHLTGVPRYADFIENPPFHWWCRTATALYLPGYDDEFLTRMRGASSAELEAQQQTGTKVVIHPSNAFSGRKS